MLIKCTLRPPRPVVHDYACPFGSPGKTRGFYQQILLKNHGAIALMKIQDEPCRQSRLYLSKVTSILTKIAPMAYDDKAYNNREVMPGKSHCKAVRRLQLPSMMR